MESLLRRAVIELAARTTPLNKAEAELLLEFTSAVVRFERDVGYECDFGLEGERLCVPSRWAFADLTARKKTCGHCPVLLGRLKE